MHTSCLQWLERSITKYELAPRSTLECGSYDQNGSARPFFTGAYLGIDSRPGPGVDQIMSAGDLAFGDASFEVVVCTEMLEHDPTFWMSLCEMSRVLQPSGYLLLSTRSNGFPDHHHPVDYYRFTIEAITFLMTDLAELELVDIEPDPEPGVFAVGRKP
jgi:SAM-dependent methyltransferase